MTLSSPEKIQENWKQRLQNTSTRTWNSKLPQLFRARQQEVEMTRHVELMSRHTRGIYTAEDYSAVTRAASCHMLQHG